MQTSDSERDPRSEVGPDLSELEQVLGVRVGRSLLTRALTHRSFAYENGGLPTNERLEFLGDAVLGVVVTDHLFRAHPDLAEGRLAKLRAAVVNMRALADVGRNIGLGQFVFLGRGEEVIGGWDKSSILADTLEALIGAVYLELGIDEATALVHRLLGPAIAESASLGAGLDWKTSLQELASERGVGVPEYVITESGPDHAKAFTAEVRLRGESLGVGLGSTKKAAEQQAARTAWTALNKKPDSDGVPARSA